MSSQFRRLIWIVVCLGCAGLGGRPALAQTRQLQIDMDSATPAARSLSPILIVWRVTSQSSNLTEGHFEITVTDDREVLAQVATEDLVLSAGQQTIRTLLPPLESVSYMPELTLHVKFVGKREALNLGKHLLRVPPITHRGLVVGVSNPWQSATSPALDVLVQQIRLEKMIPEPPEGRPLALGTSSARMLPNDLPQTALSYCVFDVLVLPEDGFSTLRSQQLTAILDWVRAGGSVCVVPGHVVLSPTHVEFLNALSGTAAGVPPYLLDSTGHLMPPDDVSIEDASTGGQAASAIRPSPKTYRVGLGRAVVALGQPDQIATWWDSLAWREAVAFLWRVRRDQVATLTADPSTRKQSNPANDPQNKDAADAGLQQQPGDSIGGQAGSATPQPAAGSMPSAPGAVGRQFHPFEDYTQFHQWAPIPIHTVDQLLMKLMPHSMRVMPLGLMMMLLGVYVLVIGPGDYFGLGWIRRRKWTWVLFPGVTIGFTLLILWLSQWYLGISDNRRALTIVDLGDDGRVVRQNRMELVITGSSRAVSTPVKQAFFTSIAHHHFGGSLPWNQMQFAGATPMQANLVAGGFNPNQHDVTDPGPTAYVGRVPSQYTATQNLPQWTPRLNRQLAIQPADPDVAVDWEHVRSLLPNPEQANESAWQPLVLQFLSERFGRDAAVHVLNGQERLIQSEPYKLLFSDQQNNGQYVQVTRTVGGRTQTSWEPQQTKTNFLRDICVVKQPGMFSVVSQISPSGGHTFDDLTLLDPSDERQWLIVVSVPRGQDYVMYRKVLVK